MKSMKRIGICLFIIIVMFWNSVSNGVNILMEADNLEVKENQEIKVIVKLEDIDVKQGINAIQGKLEYDKNIFEKVTSTNLVTKNNWSIVYNEEEGQEEGKFIMITFSEGEKENQELLEITLKTKQNLESTKSEIKLTELGTSDSEKIINIDEQTIEVKVQGSKVAKVANKQLVIVAMVIAIIVLVVITILKVRKYKNQKTETKNQ